MAKTVEGSFVGQVKAEPWTEGKLIAGVFRSADVLPNCDSRKINFETSKGVFAAVWETAALAQKIQKMAPGGVYRILCLGKILETKNGKAWDFVVEEAENQGEAEEWGNQYRTYVMNGGK